MGQHCLYQNGRLFGCAIQGDCGRRKVWSVQLVKHFVHQVYFVQTSKHCCVVGPSGMGASGVAIGLVHCHISIRFSAVFSAFVLRSMYMCVNTSQWLFFIFFSFSRGDRSSGWRHWDVWLLKLSRGLGRVRCSKTSVSDVKITDDICCNCMRAHCMKDDTKPTGHEKLRRE